MSKMISTVAAAVLALSAGIAVQAASGEVRSANPNAFPSLTQIYATTGVVDSGGALNTGVATTAHCTNWTPSAQDIRFVVRNPAGGLVAGKTYGLGASATLTVSTHFTAVFNETDVLAPEVAVTDGSMRIFATAANITCTVAVVDAAASVPVGIDLHLMRSNPVSGTQE